MWAGVVECQEVGAGGASGLNHLHDTLAPEMGPWNATHQFSDLSPSSSMSICQSQSTQEHGVKFLEV